MQIIAEKNNDFYEINVYQSFLTESIYEIERFNRLKIKSVSLPGIGSLTKIKMHLSQYKKEDIIFDFTAGDSFTDIYGNECFYSRSARKILAIWSKTPFVLGSQTLGPYNKAMTKLIAKYILKKSYYVFARDDLSIERAKAISDVRITRTADVAFSLQYKKVQYKSKCIGINPSGLLWNRGEQFNLTVNYKNYLIDTISYILKETEYEVVLVSHVLSNNLNDFENDMVASIELKKLFPSVTIAPTFNSPAEAKSFIASLDAFMGARMHATIAAFTTGVPVLPFSYSPKFEGLYRSLNYRYLISGTVDSDSEATDKTIEFLKHIQQIDMASYKAQVESSNQDLIEKYEKVLYSLR